MTPEREAVPPVPCFDCGEPLLAGPRGGLSIDMACPACLSEFCLALWCGEVIFLDPLGKLGADRARLYGIEI